MDVDYSGIGRLLSSPARSVMLALMFEGGAVSATALARGAGVAPSTASGHLGALVRGGLVTVEASGKHRHYRIASREIAEALEALGRVCPRGAVRSLRASREAAHMSFARTCYDHLAGQVGVAVLDALLRGRWLSRSGDHFELGPASHRFGDVEIDTAAARHQRRSFARGCLDVTERRPHLAGALGAALCTAMLERGWLTRRPTGRGLRLTERGVDGLTGVLGVDAAFLAPAMPAVSR